MHVATLCPDAPPTYSVAAGSHVASPSHSARGVATLQLVSLVPPPAHLPQSAASLPDPPQPPSQSDKGPGWMQALPSGHLATPLQLPGPHRCEWMSYASCSLTFGLVLCQLICKVSSCKPTLQLHCLCWDIAPSLMLRMCTSSWMAQVARRRMSSVFLHVGPVQSSLIMQQGSLLPCCLWGAP